MNQFIGKFCIVRAENAGVFAGIITSFEGKAVVLEDSRRIWWWEGAASLSQLAQEGTSKPESCKFPCKVKRTAVLEVIEVIECTDVAKKSIENVPVWSA